MSNKKHSEKIANMYSIICDYYTNEREYPSVRHLCNVTRLQTKSVTDILRALRIDGYIEQRKHNAIIGLPLMRSNWLTKPIRVAA